ncbi:MAG: autotransporter assembly complex protein TamA [Azonexus sp.]|jgi:translocation and assembly module TamA|nr:autotransporter assembly complex protein TamA [Azonexus sp.]
MFCRCCLPLFGFLAVTPAAALEVDAPAAIVRLIEPHRAALDELSAQQAEAVRQLLATEGYFSPQIEFVDSDKTPRLKIDPGPRTVVGEVHIAIDGAVDAARQRRLRESWQLPVGQPFRQDDWSLAKQRLLADLLASGHPGARLVNSLADIDSEHQRANLTAQYDAGPYYRFGELQINGVENYPPDLIPRYNRRIKPGDPYDETRLQELQAKLRATPYFRTVRAGLDLAAGETNADGSITAPLKVEVRERQPHRVSFGGGFSSNTGGRVEANYHTPNLAGQAWSLDSGLRLEQKRQLLFADIFLPPDERDRRNGFGAVNEKTDIEKLKTDRYAFGVQSIQQRGSIEQRLSLFWQREQREADGADKVTSRALTPNALWTWRQVDDLLDPRRGVVLQLQVGGGAKAALSDQNFLRLHGRWQQFIPLNDANQLTLRGELGRTFADSRQRVPQDFLFRTGGTGSIRGYGYQSLGVKEGAAVAGGRYLGIASAELTHWLGDSWGLAAFVDTGNAVDALRAIRLATGYGLGARWRSPAGPLGVDLAYGEMNHRLHLHFSLAIAF